MERKKLPPLPNRATHSADNPCEQHGAAPSPAVPSPSAVSISFTLSQDDLALLRRVFTAAEALLAKLLEPPQPPVSPPPIIEQALPEPSEQPEPKSEPRALTVAVETLRRRHKHREQPPLAAQEQQEELTEAEQEEFRAKYAISVQPPPRARHPGALVFLQGTPEEIHAATPIRNRLWAGAVRWLAVESSLGRSHEQVED